MSTYLVRNISRHFNHDKELCILCILYIATRSVCHLTGFFQKTRSKFCTNLFSECHESYFTRFENEIKTSDEIVNYLLNFLNPKQIKTIIYYGFCLIRAGESSYLVRNILFNSATVWDGIV